MGMGWWDVDKRHTYFELTEEKGRWWMELLARTEDTFRPVRTWLDSAAVRIVDERLAQVATQFIHSTRAMVENVAINNGGRRAWLYVDGRYRIEMVDPYEGKWLREYAAEEVELELRRSMGKRRSFESILDTVSQRQWWRSLDCGHSRGSAQRTRAGEVDAHTLTGWAGVAGELSTGSLMPMGDVIAVDKQIGRLLATVAPVVVECRVPTPDRVYEQVLMQYRKEKEKVDEEEWQAVKERERRQHVHGSKRGRRIRGVQSGVQGGGNTGGSTDCEQAVVFDVTDGTAATALPVKPVEWQEAWPTDWFEECGEWWTEAGAGDYEREVFTHPQPQPAAAEVPQTARAVHGADSPVPEERTEADQDHGQRGR